MSLGHSPSVVTSNLNFYLDAANTKSYPGSGTTWTDLSESKNNGTLVNSPTFDSTNGGSLVFNGSNTYVSSFPTQISGTGSKTISCFFKTTSTLRQGICGTRDSATAVGWVFTINRSTAGNLSYFHTGGSTIQIAAGITTNTWYHAAVTYDSATATATLYLNGAQIGTPTTSFSTISSSGYNGIIGAEDQALSQILNGNIGQVLIYSRALSATEITQNFNAIRGRYGL